METSERNIEANMNELIGRIEAKYEEDEQGAEAPCRICERKL